MPQPPRRIKVLLLDDDPDVLEVYKELLLRLPSAPEIQTATSGARALSLLGAEPFTLLISDLNMPKMDGLQVLTVVRRKYPQLRTVVLTGVVDERLRTRSYAIGIDLYLEKPQTAQEVQFFLDCIEGLIGRDETGGFRGVQSKSLVDIIQLECLSQNSAVLKITNGSLEGRIWLHNGDIIDAAALDLNGEMAFREILSWKTGNFELLPPEPAHPRTIVSSAQGLLLETAQAFDEAQAAQATRVSEPQSGSAEPSSAMAAVAQIRGVEFGLLLVESPEYKVETWGVENQEKLTAWVRQTSHYGRWLGEFLKVGQFQCAHGRGLQQHAALQGTAEKTLCIGFHRSFTADQVRDTLKRMAAKWAS